MSVEFDLGAPPAPTRDAATVVLLRDAPHGLEVFFVKRHAELRFMGGAFVFPGGKLDPNDLDPLVPADLTATEAAARLGETDAVRARGLHVTAARECLEESGVLFSVGPSSAVDTATMRSKSIPGGDTFAAVLREHAVTLRISALVPWCRWITPRGETRRFDARFFMARAPDDARAVHDAGETVASAWFRPSDALARAERQEIVLVPPTYRCVQVLAQQRTVAEALACAPESIPTLEPRVMPGEGGAVLIVLPDDPLHDVGAAAMFRDGTVDPTRLATRFAFGPDGWSAKHVARTS